MLHSHRVWIIPFFGVSCSKSIKGNFSGCVPRDFSSWGHFSAQFRHWSVGRFMARGDQGNLQRTWGRWPEVTFSVCHLLSDSGQSLSLPQHQWLNLQWEEFEPGGLERSCDLWARGIPRAVLPLVLMLWWHWPRCHSPNTLLCLCPLEDVCLSVKCYPDALLIIPQHPAQTSLPPPRCPQTEGLGASTWLAVLWEARRQLQVCFSSHSTAWPVTWHRAGIQTRFVE